MKTYKRIFFLSLILIIMPLHAQERVIDNLILPFLESLQQGDVKKLESFISGEFFNQNKILLQKNADYPNFLRKHYAGAEFKVSEIEANTNDAMIEVTVLYPNGSTSTTTLRVKYIDHTNSWKIVEQLKEM